MIAQLAMYDWPEFRAETDALWAGLRQALSDIDFDAPAALDRDRDMWSAWRDPDLVLAQTCGLPFAARLAGEVSLLGAPIYDAPGCGAGTYRSWIVVRAADPAETLADLAGRRFAYNGRGSQSGWAALAAEVAPEAHFGALHETGAHRASIQAVAEGKADCAAIDAVSWALAEAVEPAAAQLRILMGAKPTPGLPFITRRRSGAEVAAMQAAIGDAIEALPASVKAALRLTGFKIWEDADYAPLAAGWPEAA